MREIILLLFTGIIYGMAGQNYTSKSNCVGYPAQMICCDTGKRATVKIIESKAEFKAHRLYEKFKTEFDTLDFEYYNLILVSNSELPFSTKTESTSRGVNWKEELYKKMQVACGDMFLDYKFVFYENIFWKAVPKTVKGNTKCSCSAVSSAKAELVKDYSQAIAEYIKAAYKRDKTVFDTLFFGKHDQFPDIKLPATIQSTKIIILTPAEADKKRKYRKSWVFINLVATIADKKAEYIFVTFNPGYIHQYDCTINFKYNYSRKEFELQDVEFKDYAAK